MLITDQSKIAQGAMDDLTIFGQQMGTFCPNVVNILIYRVGHEYLPKSKWL